MHKQACPACGHDNVERAVFCFKCGTNLDKPPIERGIHRNRRHIEDAMRYVNERGDTLEPELVHTLREARATLPPVGDGTPLRCLRCGTFNRPLAGYCIGCGANLSLPDSEQPLRLMALASARSDVGQVRENNEDRVGLWAGHGVVLALVADGMGGAVAGEVASRLVVEAVQADFLGEARGSESLLKLSETEIGDKLRQAVRRANRAVIEQASHNPELQGMGTTATLAFVRDRRVVIAHVGDSRAYLIDGQEGWINQITDDHSLVEALLSSGHITPDQAAVHPMRNVLYRALGQVDDTQADLYSRTLTDGDWLLLCSDGLTRHVSVGEIAEISGGCDSPEEVVDRLVELANDRGGEDNVSVVVISMQPVDELVANYAPSLNDTAVGLYQAQNTGHVSLDETQEIPSLDDDDIEDV